MAPCKHAKPITFGLELEFNLAFHQSQLNAVLKDYGIPHKLVDDAPCVKVFTKPEHEALLTTIQDEPSHECRARYPSWGICMPSEYPEDPYWKETMKQLVQFSPNGGAPVRRYMTEHLLIAQKAIRSRQSNAKIDICAFMRPGNSTRLPNGSRDDYIRCQSANLSHWTLTNDHTLMGSLKPQLLEAVPSKVNLQTINGWDSMGVELISPILQLFRKKDAVRTLAAYLKALQQSTDYDILTSKWAGMHVHIGLNINTPAELDANVLFFQHLVYILVLSEDLISACFSRKSSGLAPSEKHEQERCILQATTPSGGDAFGEEEKFLAEIEELEKIPENETSDQHEMRMAKLSELDQKLMNLSPEETEPELDEMPKTEEELQALNDERVLAAEALYTGFDSINSNARYLASTLGLSHPIPPPILASTIFQPGQLFRQLIDKIQSPLSSKEPHGERFRGHMYNFSNLYNIALGKSISETWKEPKPTIEFRQHECTIDATEVAHWVKFTEAIVRKAAKLASGSEKSIEGEGEREGELQPYWQREAAKYPIFPLTRMTALCRWLGLDEQEQEYWEARWEKYKDDRP